MPGARGWPRRSSGGRAGNGRPLVSQTAATSIQNDSGLPQGPADLPPAGWKRGKRTAAVAARLLV